MNYSATLYKPFLRIVPVLFMLILTGISSHAQTSITAGTLKGNPFVCAGDIPQEIKGDVSTGGSGDFTYLWQISTDNSAWTDITNSNTKNYIPAPITANPTYFRRVTKDNIYDGLEGTTSSFKISIVAAGTTLYWNRNAINNNWNDPTNWTNASGVVQNRLPVACTDVYIPSAANNYPSLHPDYTPSDIWIACLPEYYICLRFGTNIDRIQSHG